MRKAEFLLFCLTSLVCSSMQQTNPRPNFNPKTDGVVELNHTNFQTLVLNSDDTWLVDFEFSGADCSYCIRISVVIKKAVPLLKEKKIKVGFADYNKPDSRKLIDAYGVTGFPALFIFGKEKEYPVKFLPYAEKTAEEFARSVEFNTNRSRPAEGVCGDDSVENQESNVYELTDENFEEVVLKCEEPWIINFYVPDSSICIQFMPYFNAAAQEFKGRIKFGSFFQIGSKIAEHYVVRRTCTVKLFPAGDKSSPPVDYNNGTHSNAISSNLIPWLKNVLVAGLPAPAINELTSQSVLDSKCKNSGVTACIFFFLAKSDKCNAECARTYLDQLMQMANDMKGENWAWFWTTQGKQPMFEQTFGLQYFPGVSAVDMQTQTFSTNRGTTSMNKLKELLRSFANGILPSKNLPSSGLPTVKA